MEFINGITLLNAIPITEHSPIMATLFWILIGVTLIAFIICWIFLETGLKKLKYAETISNIFGISGCVTMVSAVIMAMFWAGSEVPTGEYRYQVTVNGDTSLVEFYEKYDLIEQEGKIYTIELKEGGETK